MKKIICLALALMMAAAMFCVNVSAEEATDVETVSAKDAFLKLDVIFEDGMSAPPHVGYANVKKNATDFVLFHPEEYMRAMFAYRYAMITRDNEPNWVQPDGKNMWLWSVFYENNGITDYAAYVQVDAKVDDGDWQHTAAWDQNNFVGTNMLAKTDLAFAAKLDPSGDSYTVITAGANDYENHTVTFRYRYVFQYTKTDAEPTYVVGDWSDTWSVGQNGTQTAPEVWSDADVPAPVITEAVFVINETNHHAILAVNVDMGEKIYDIAIYDAINGVHNTKYENYSVPHKNLTYDDFRISLNGETYSTWAKHDYWRVTGGFYAFEPINISQDIAKFDAAHLSIAVGVRKKDSSSVIAWSEYTDVTGYEHAWDEGVVLREPTYFLDGEMKYTCTGCGAVKSASIPYDGPIPPQTTEPIPDTDDDTVTTDSSVKPPVTSDAPDASTAPGESDADQNDTEKNNLLVPIIIAAVAVVVIAAVVIVVIKKKKA